MKKQFFTEIYGCQMNVSDTFELEEALQEKQWNKTGDPEQADAIIINTCAVRQSAEDRVLSRLGYYKYLKAKKSFILVFMGCVAQNQKENIFKKYPFVDFVVGASYRSIIPDLLEQAISTFPQQIKSQKPTKIFVSLEKKMKQYLPSVVDKKFPYRSFISISHGCSKFCTYCIVPFTRGREQSIPSEIILENIKKMIQQGVKEIYFLGQNVNSYGFDQEGFLHLHELLHKASLIQGVERIKFMSSHPRDISDEFIQEIARNPKISRHFHFAMQSASDEILRRMNRQHTYAHFQSLIEKLRNQIPDISITTDIIVGFPGETKKDFQKTVEALEALEFHSAFIYMYSERKGTAAENFNDTVPLEEKKKRAQILMSIQEKITQRSLLKMLGSVVFVLVERRGKQANQYVGFNEYDMATIFLSTDPGLIGQFVLVLITDVKGKTLIGDLLG